MRKFFLLLKTEINDVMKKFPWLSIMPILVILIIGAILRCLFLVANGLWMDEVISYTVYHNLHSLKEIVDYLFRYEYHPPGYYFFMRGWISLFGDSLLSLRLSSYIPSVIAIPLAYQVAKNITKNNKVSLLTAALVSFSPYLIYYAQEVRPYSLIFLISLFSINFFWKYLEKPTWKISLALGIVSALGLFMHYSYLFLIFGQGIIILYRWISRKQRFKWAEFFCLAAPLVGVGIWILPVIYFRMSESIGISEHLISLSEIVRWRSSFPFETLGHFIFSPLILALSNHILSLVVTFCIIGVIFIIVKIFMTGSLLPGELRKTAIILTSIFMAGWGAYLLSPQALASDFFYNRQVTMLYFPFLLLLAIAMAGALRFRKILLTIIFSLGLFSSVVNTGSWNSHYQVVKMIQETSTENSSHTLMLSGFAPGVIFGSYYHPSGVDFGSLILDSTGEKLVFNKFESSTLGVENKFFVRQPLYKYFTDRVSGLESYDKIIVYYYPDEYYGNILEASGWKEDVMQTLQLKEKYGNAAVKVFKKVSPEVF